MHPDQHDLGVMIRLSFDVIGIMAGWQYVLKPTLIAEFRQRIFSLRRDMFIFMATGNVNPDDAAYQLLRNTMNGLLRFAERMTTTRLLLNQLLLRKVAQRYNKLFYEGLSAVADDEVRHKLQWYDWQMGCAIRRHYVLRSPLMWLVLRAVKIVKPPRQCCLAEHDPRTVDAMQYYEPGVTRGIEAEAELVMEGRRSHLVPV